MKHHIDISRVTLPIPAPLTPDELSQAADLLDRAVANGQLLIGSGDLSDEWGASWESVEAPSATCVFVHEDGAGRLDIVTPSSV